MGGPCNSAPGMTVSVVLAVYCRDRQRSIARFHEALAQLQGSPMLPQAGVSVTAAEDTAGSELMAVATAAVAAVATVEVHMQQHADGCSWQGGLSHDACMCWITWSQGLAWSKVAWLLSCAERRSRLCHGTVVSELSGAWREVSFWKLHVLSLVFVPILFWREAMCMLRFQPKLQLGGCRVGARVVCLRDLGSCMVCCTAETLKIQTHTRHHAWKQTHDCCLLLLVMILPAMSSQTCTT